MHPWNAVNVQPSAYPLSALTVYTTKSYWYILDSITQQNGCIAWLRIVMEKCINESYHTSSTLEKYASIWGTWFPVHNSIRVVSLRVRNTKIVITGTSPTSTATTFGNLVTVRLDHGWQTKGFHWPCESGWKLKEKAIKIKTSTMASLSLSTNIRYYKIQNGFATLPKKQIANLQTRCMCKQLVRRESNLQDLSCFQHKNKKTMAVQWCTQKKRGHEPFMNIMILPAGGYVRKPFICSL